MARKYPKYIKETGSTLGYQRAVPTRLQHIATKKLFSYPLKLAITATDADIHIAWANADKAFALYCKTLENSNPAAYTENEIDRLAEEILRRKGLKLGQFADVIDPDLAKREEEQQEQLQAHPSDYADHAIPEFEDVVHDIYSDGQRQPTIQEAAILRAHKAVQTRRKQAPKTLSALWNEYIKRRQIDVGTREGKKIQERWLQFLSVTKDTHITPNTPDHIEAGIDEFVAIESERGLSPASIKRSLSEPLACFRWANKQHRLKWRAIEIPPLTSRQAKERKPLTIEHQKKLVEYCRESNDWVSAAMLTMLQGGCMPSEIARLRPDEDINLNAEIPHIVISGGVEGKTKRDARKRIVPIVLGTDILKRNLLIAVERLAKSKDPSATISKRLRTQISAGYSSHCLRHSFRLNGVSAGTNPQYLQAIGGWSGGNVNKIMLNYGAAGTGYSEILKILQEESRKIHRHLLSY